MCFKLTVCFILQDLEKLYDQLNKDCSSEAEANMHKADIQKDIFKVLSYQAESVCLKNNSIHCSSMMATSGFHPYCYYSVTILQ